MKKLLFFVMLACVGMPFSLFAQEYEIKVISNQYATVVGNLMKVSPEGIGVEDYKGRYFTFRPHELVRIKIRRPGLTILEGLGGGTVLGLAAGAGIWSLDEDGNSTKEMLTLTAVLTGVGAVGGTITGVIAQIASVKLTLRINEDPKKFRSQFQQLLPYVNKAVVEHFN